MLVIQYSDSPTPVDETGNYIINQLIEPVIDQPQLKMVSAEQDYYEDSSNEEKTDGMSRIDHNRSLIGFIRYV